MGHGDSDERITPLALQQGGMNCAAPGDRRHRSPGRGSNCSLAHQPLGVAPRQPPDKSSVRR